MNLSDQSRAPIFEALERYKSMRIVPFDVPGHKRGKGNPEFPGNAAGEREAWESCDLFEFR